MLINKKTRLVAVRSNQRGGRPGIWGVPPETARAGVLSGEIALANVPSHIAVIEVADPTPEKQPELVMTPGEPVEIPDDWEQKHPLTWIKLAKAIIGGDIVLTDEQKTAEVKVSDLAKAIIAEEIQRRAAAETPTE